MRLPHEIVKHTQTIRRQQPPNCLSVFGHLVELVLKGLAVALSLPKLYSSFTFPHNTDTGMKTVKIKCEKRLSP